MPIRTVVLALLLAAVTLVPAQPLPEASSIDPGIRAYRPAVPGVHGLVTTAGKPLASMAGARMLLEGGNAVDAAVAILATLNVVEPEMSGAGGNGFMLIYQKSTGTITALHMTGAAPRNLRPEKLAAEALATGVTASPVPGLLGGWIAALERYGTRSLAECLKTAIDYAENGHPIDPSVVRSIQSRLRDLELFDTSVRVFLPEGSLPVPGQLFRMPDLAATFRKLAQAEQSALRSGAARGKALEAAHDRFYKGDIAQEMIRFIQETGGVMSLEDLADYQPVWADPLHTTYRGYDIYSTGPSSRGGLEVLMQLNLIEGFDLRALGHASAAAIHLQAEAIKLAKADIYRFVADPKFAQVPIGRMLSKEYAAQRRSLIDLNKSMPYPAPGILSGDSGVALGPDAAAQEASVEGHTSSFSVVDSAGNVVVCTPTLGSGFGTAAVLGRTGILFNNGLRHGSTAPYPEHVNYARGGQIPILNNSPVLVFRNGKFVMALGTPGGETIGQTQFQAILNLLDFALPIQEAIEAPRFALDADPNFYKTGSHILLRLEDGIRPEAVKTLEDMGHVIQRRARFGGIGNIQAIFVNLDTGTMMAGADPRRSGYAIGW